MFYLKPRGSYGDLQYQALFGARVSASIPAAEPEEIPGPQPNPKITHIIGDTLELTSDIKFAYISPATTIETLTINLPTVPSDNDEIEFHFGGFISVGEPVVNNLLWARGDVYENQVITSTKGGDSFTLRYNAIYSKWYIV